MKKSKIPVKTDLGHRAWLYRTNLNLVIPAKQTGIGRGQADMVI